MSTAPTASPQPPAGGPPATPTSGGGAKVLLWILGIFVGFLLLAMVSCAAIGFFIAHKARQFAENPVYSAAKFAVAANPDLETISSDDSSGTIKIRDRKTGKVGTLKFDAASKTMVVIDENGKKASMRFDADKKTIVMSDDQGKTATITGDGQAGNIEIKGPDGSMKIGANADKAPSWVPVYPGVTPQNTFSASNDSVANGTFVFTTKDDVGKVLSYYGDTLKSGGFKVSTTTSNNDGKNSGLVTGNNDGEKQTVVVTAGDDTDGTKVSVSYTVKK